MMEVAADVLRDIDIQYFHVFGAFSRSLPELDPNIGSGSLLLPINQASSDPNRIRLIESGLRVSVSQPSICELDSGGEVLRHFFD
jgi:hypothetical protein